jgi:hypothetical protein
VRGREGTEGSHWDSGTRLFRSALIKAAALIIAGVREGVSEPRRVGQGCNTACNVGAGGYERPCHEHLNRNRLVREAGEHASEAEVGDLADQAVGFGLG